MYTKTITVVTDPNSLRQRILALAVGEFLFVPFDESKENTVRNYASTLSFLEARRYSVSRDRVRQGVTVTREA